MGHRLGVLSGGSGLLPNHCPAPNISATGQGQASEWLQPSGLEVLGEGKGEAFDCPPLDTRLNSRSHINQLLPQAKRLQVEQF